jgi:hypothetical protein
MLRMADDGPFYSQTLKRPAGIARPGEVLFES